MVSCDGSTLHLWRTSDGGEAYRARLMPTDDGAEVTALLVAAPEEIGEGGSPPVSGEPAQFVNELTSVLWAARRLRAGDPLN